MNINDRIGSKILVKSFGIYCCKLFIRFQFDYVTAFVNHTRLLRKIGCVFLYLFNSHKYQSFVEILRILCY